MFLGDIGFNAAPLAPQHSLRRTEGKKSEGRLAGRRRIAHGLRVGRDIGRCQRRQSRGARSRAALTIKFCENLVDGEERGWRTRSRCGRCLE